MATAAFKMIKLRNIIGTSLVVLLPACTSAPSTESEKKGARIPQSEIIRASDEGIRGMAAREVIRRQEKIRRADAAALEASRASAEGDQEGAIRSYRKALDDLPAGD
ncbi:MAG: hypothetical protein GXP30_06915 [Verrucomicrobia bacterium]|nr:hypothetical protein [Verrucomicrobiota bacterium]